MAKKPGPKTTWSSEAMGKALDHYRNSSDGFGVTGAKFGIPKTTLQLHWDRKNRSQGTNQPVKSGQVRSNSSNQSDQVRLNSLNLSDQNRTNSPNQSERDRLSSFKTTSRGRWSTYLKLGIGALVGLFIQELVHGQTGDTLFGWLTGQPKLQRTNERNVEAVLPSTTDKYFQAQPQPQLQGYDLSVFK